MSETKREKTKNAIIEAGIQLLGNNPSTPMEEIASSINLNRRTIHRYFKGKKELIEEIFNYACEICYKNTRDCILSTDNPQEQLKAMFFSDIESGSRFHFLNSFYEQSNETSLDSENYKAMMSLFRTVLNTLHSEKRTAPNLTLDWIEIYYMSVVEAAIKSIRTSSLGQNLIMDMAWKTFVNGISLNT